jgi:hypothetical protein
MSRTVTRRIASAAALATVVGLLTIGVLGADEQSDVRDIESYLRDVKSYLDGIGGDSSSSEIDYAMAKANEVKKIAERLRSGGPQSEPAKTMAEKYPDWVGSFLESCMYLKQMKDAQLRQQEARLMERCTEDDRKLRSTIREYIDRNNPEGVVKIPQLAEELGRPISEELRKMDDINREMERWRDYSRRFSETHGNWSDVKSELHDGANDIWETWKRRREETTYKCQDLAKQRLHPEVISALEKLAASADSRKRIYEKLEEGLSQMAGFVSTVDQDSDASKVSQATSAADRLEEYRQTLDSAKGEDQDRGDVEGSDPYVPGLGGGATQDEDEPEDPRSRRGRLPRGEGQARRPHQEQGPVGKGAAPTGRAGGGPVDHREARTW